MPPLAAPLPRRLPARGRGWLCGEGIVAVGARDGVRSRLPFPQGGGGRDERTRGEGSRLKSLLQSVVPRHCYGYSFRWKSLLKKPLSEAWVGEVTRVPPVPS